MPLRFDASSLMAPGGIVDGLDNMGAAVVQALNRRAERKYGEARDVQERGYRVTDMDRAAAEAAKNHARNRGEDLADMATRAGREEAQSKLVQEQQLADRAARDEEQVAGLYGPEMDANGADLYGDLRGYMQSVDDEPKLRGLMTRRDAAKAAYQQNDLKIAARQKANTPKLPPVARLKGGGVDFAATIAGLQDHAMLYPQLASQIDQRVKQLAKLREFESTKPKPTSAQSFSKFDSLGDVMADPGMAAVLAKLNAASGNDTEQSLYQLQEQGGNQQLKMVAPNTWWDSDRRNMAMDPAFQAEITGAFAQAQTQRGDTRRKSYADELATYNKSYEELLTSVDGQIQDDTAGGLTPDDLQWVADIRAQNPAATKGKTDAEVFAMASADSAP